MNTFTRWLLTLVLAAVPMLAVSTTASANSELVPASRLVAPYLAVAQTGVAPNSSKNTFLLLTNVSPVVDLRGAATVPAPPLGPFYSIHLEFYNRNCNRTDRAVHLSLSDVDQVNVVASDIAEGFSEGFLDLDVRVGFGATGGPLSDLPAATSAQQNVLLGEVVIADIAADYTLSYPMASILGSAAGGAGNPIVTRDPATELASVWTGRYEPLPTTIDLPGYYAEGGAAGVGGTVTESLLAVASPADGNWYGAAWGGSCFVVFGCGEAPGQTLATTTALGAPFNLIKMPSITVWDGCEHSVSRAFNGHYMSGSLTGLFGALLDRNAAAPGPWSDANCAAGVFLGFDELSHVPIGWIKLPNTSCVRSAKFNIGATALCADPSLPPTASAAKVRGVAGVFLEAAVVASTIHRGADTARLWGERNSIILQTGCADSGGAAISPAALGTCRYNLESATGAPVSEP